MILDSDAVLADKFKALKTPHAFLIGRDGKILYRGGVTSSTIGSTADKNYLKAALQDVQSDRRVKTPEGRTLGCEIKRGGQNVW